MKTITLTNNGENVNFDQIGLLFGKVIEIGTDISKTELSNLRKGSERLVKVEDDFGWDYLEKLSDGRLIWFDRNSGCADITLVSVLDLETFVEKFCKILSE